MTTLTKRSLADLAPHPTGKDRFLWDQGDGSLKGFGVRIKPSGAASFLVQYRTRQGRTRRLVLGRVNVMSPDDARKQAREKLLEVAKGGDPSGDRKKIRRSITVGELCDRYLRQSELEGRIKASTLRMDRSRIDVHVKPLIGSLPLLSLRQEDIERMQHDIATGKTAKQASAKQRGGIARGGRVVASRTVGMLATILEMARRWGVTATNPARDVVKLPEGKQTRFLNLEEMAKLGEALRSNSSWAQSGVGQDAIRFILLTGFRRMEALALEWPWVDWRCHCVRFPDTKSGAQFRAIGEPALELLDNLRMRNASDGRNTKWVFPGAKLDEHFVGLPKVLHNACFRAKLQGITVHVLRHSFSATAAEMGFSELTIAGLLGHAVAGVTARYAHMPDRALIAAADQISNQISAALDGRLGDTRAPFSLGNH